MIAYFGILNSDNQVINTICVDQADVDANGVDQSVEAENFVKTNLLKDESALVKQFSDDGSFRVNRAETNGGYYDPSNDVFILPKPFSSAKDAALNAGCVISLIKGFPPCILSI